MSVHFKQKGDPSRYWFLEANCLGCECFQPGQYQTRGATLSGSRNTGNSSARCMRNAYHGCPNVDERGFSDELLAQRKREGWKKIS